MQGYYEFRVKASKTDYGSTITLRDNDTQMPFVIINLYGDAIDRPELNTKASIGINPETAEGIWAEPSLSGNSSAGYHIYGILVENNSVSVYIDGKLEQSQAVSVPNNMQIQVGCGYPNSANGDSYARLTDGRDVNFYVDYVRYYTK